MTTKKFAPGTKQVPHGICFKGETLTLDDTITHNLRAAPKRVHRELPLSPANIPFPFCVSHIVFFQVFAVTYKSVTWLHSSVKPHTWGLFTPKENHHRFPALIPTHIQQTCPIQTHAKLKPSLAGLQTYTSPGESSKSGPKAHKTRLQCKSGSLRCTILMNKLRTGSPSDSPQLTIKVYRQQALWHLT